MHPRQQQLMKQAGELAEKLAAKGEKKQSLSPMLWKYTDPEGNEFWLKVKKMTVKSPFTGKNFTSKPERETPSGVGTDLREEAKGSPAGAGPGGKVNNKRKKSADWKVGAEHPGELKELEELLQSHGYDPKDAKKLNEEGMGPYELEHILKTTHPGGMGSLEYTHRIHKKG